MEHLCQAIEPTTDAPPDGQQAATNEDLLRNDMRRKIQESAKAMQAREEELNDEEPIDAAMEYFQSCQRLEKLSAIVSEQHMVHDKIMTRVRVGEKEAAAHMKAPCSLGSTEFLSACASDDPPSPSSPSREAQHQVRPASAAGCYSTAPKERNVYAHIFAEKLELQQVRSERLQDGQRSVLEKQRRKHDAVYEAFEDEDRRQSKRTKHRLQQEIEKTYRSQQKYDDHQKMLRQIQRDQENQHKLLLAGVCANRRQPIARPASSPAKTRSTPIQKEVIYKDMLQSHTKYKGVLLQLQETQADNERRNEAMWRKVAPEALHAKREMARRLSATFKTAVRSISKSSTSRCDSKSRLEQTDVNVAPEALEPLARTYITEDKETPSTASTYEKRLQRCKSYQQELDVARQEKLARDTAKLVAHQERGKEEMAKRAEAAGSMVQAWESKSFDASASRASLRVADGEEFFRKHEEQAVLHSEFKERQQEELEERAAVAAQMQSQVRTTGHQSMQKIEQDRRTRHKMQTAASELQHGRNAAGMSQRAGSAKHARECEAIRQRKQGLDQKFRKQVEVEIDSKLARSAQALGKVTKAPTAIEALVKRRPQSSPSLPRRLCQELRLPSDMTPSSGLLSLSTRRDEPASPPFFADLANDTCIGALLTGQSEDTFPELKPRQSFYNAPSSHSRAISPASSDKARWRGHTDPGDMEEVLDATRHRDRAMTVSPLGSSLRSRSTTAADPNSPSAEQGRPASSGPRRPSNTSDQSSEEEDEHENEDFLQDLQVASAKWLREVRQNSKANVRRPL